MLHLQALPPCTLDLLISLSSHPQLADFALAGGTSLALRFGHRRSVDFDWFTTDSFDQKALGEALITSHALKVEHTNSAGLSGTIEGVKVDLVTYRYPLLHAPEQIEGIRLLSLADVVGMKLAAVTNRGAKKDFYDLHTLIEHLGLPQLLEMYQAKFPQHDPMIMLRSLSYFEDAEDQEAPESLLGLSWEDVKDGIATAVRAML
jgi:hypothetical protein